MRWLHWTIWVALASWLVTAAIYYSIPAHATPDTIVSTYAADVAPVICSVLDDYPTPSGVTGVLAGIKKDSGFTDYQTGQVLALAVEQSCPKYLGLLRRYVDTNNPGSRRMTEKPPAIINCPVCGYRIRNREICPAHTDKVGRRCPMSGQPMGVKAA